MSAARRSLSALLLTLLVLAGACGDDDTEAATAPAEEDVADAAADEESGADDGGSADEEGAEDGPAPSSGSSGRLELGDESWNFFLGDMTTAMCSVSDGSAQVQDLRAADGSWVAATVAGDVVEVVLRGPDGNRAWVTGNMGEAEGVDVDVNTMDGVLMVQGTWVRADDPGTTEEGNLVVTC
ncbi:hypothetical protein NHL50_02510 [Acidimicrobiia bacterium EGI L10123]|uniref:hypothetical protein n=1 Tax=Salinilacustrithrix flava TaxID=2957203 RepID=UPI003D7C1C7D|nr:hypothetical protein [Acidimicrobiia bacterium EGI L10123]